MTGPTTSEEQAGRFHELLLRLAGRLPDDLLARAREWLAEGRPAEVADVVAAATRAGLFAPTPPDRDLIGAHLRDTDGPLPADDVRAAVVSWQFAPLLPRDGEPVPVALDLTAGEAPPGARNDPADEVAQRAVAESPGSVALWRAWRAPSEIHPDIAPVFLVQSTAPVTRLAAITASLQAALREANVESPQVEVFGIDEPLPPYQRLARGRSALLWAARPAAEVTIAREFDRVDPLLGPRFDPDHPTLPPGDESARVLGYLSSGEVLVAGTARERDVVDDTLGEIVPQGFRTDGTWIWADSVAHYLRAYAISPDVRLLEHIRARGYVRPELDDVARHRATVELWRPVAEGAPA